MQLDADQVAFDTGRSQIDAECPELETIRAQQLAERADLASLESATIFGMDPSLTPPDLPAQKWNDDTDRFSRFFRQTPRPAAAVDVPADPIPLPVEESQPEQRLADEHAEVADSVAEYMEKLLQRSRNERASRGIVDEPYRESPAAAQRVAEAPAERVAEDLAAPAVEPIDPTPPAPDAARHRRRAVEQIRAGVGSMREIANQSARAAVAKHTSRKLRKSFAVTFPLTIGAFLLAGVISLLLGSEGRFRSLAVGAVMVGMIASIDLVRSWLKIKRSKNTGNPATRKAALEPAAPKIRTENRDLPSSGGELPEPEAQNVDEEPAVSVA